MTPVGWMSCNAIPLSSRKIGLSIATPMSIMLPSSNNSNAATSLESLTDEPASSCKFVIFDSNDDPSEAIRLTFHPLRMADSVPILVNSKNSISVEIEETPSHIIELNLMSSMDAIMLASGSGDPGVGHMNSIHSWLVSLYP